MENFFKDYDDYCLCVNNARFLTYDEAECASHATDDLAAYEADSDYAHEKVLDKYSEDEDWR